MLIFCTKNRVLKTLSILKAFKIKNLKKKLLVYRTQVYRIPNLNRIKETSSYRILCKNFKNPLPMKAKLRTEYRKYCFASLSDYFRNTPEKALTQWSDANGVNNDDYWFKLFEENGMKISPIRCRVVSSLPLVWCSVIVRETRIFCRKITLKNNWEPIRDFLTIMTYNEF